MQGQRILITKMNQVNGFKLGTKNRMIKYSMISLFQVSSTSLALVSKTLKNVWRIFTLASCHSTIYDREVYRKGLTPIFHLSCTYIDVEHTHTVRTVCMYVRAYALGIIRTQTPRVWGREQLNERINKYGVGVLAHLLASCHRTMQK